MNFTRQEIEKIQSENIRVLSQASRSTNPLHDLYTKIISETKFLDEHKNTKISFSLRVYCVLNDITETPKCKECGSKVNIKNYAHSFNDYCSDDCRKKNNNKLESDIYAILGDYQWFYTQRITNKLSYKDIAKLLDISETPVREYAKRHNLNKEKYNESSPFAKSKLRDREWLFEEHVTKHRKCEDIGYELGVSKSSVSVALAKHGIAANPANSYDRENGLESKEQREVREFIESFGFDVVSNNRTILNGSEIDIFIPSHNIGVEYHGLYSHIYRPHETSYARIKDKTYHKKKYDDAKENGVHLIQIFSDLWANKKDIVKNLIRSKLGKTDKIYARNCEIKSVSPSIKRTFLNDNHIQGNDTSSIRYGLYHKEELVAIMTFCKNKRSKKQTWELNRYCSLSGVTVVGGFSKLLKHFRKNNEGSIISYSDCMWSNGDVYKKNGFVFSHEIKAGYYYVTPCYTQRIHRTNFMKKKISTLGNSSTEKEIMQEKGYHRIFDAGMYAWVLP